MAIQDPTFGLPVRQAPPQVVRRDNLGFAPGLKVMQPARDAENLRRLRGEEANANDLYASGAATAAINADTQNLRDFNQGTVTNQVVADAALEQAQAYNAQQRAQAAQPASPYQPAERGNYNMTNTDPNALPKAVGAGLNFGFAPGGASQYLETMRTQDRLAAQDAVRNQQVLEQDQARTRLMGQLDDARNDPARYRQLLAQARLLQINADQTGKENLGLQGINKDLTVAGGQQDTARDVAGLNAQATIGSRIAASQIAGQYGLAAAQARRDGLLGAAAIKAQGSPGLEAKNLSDAQLNQLRLGLAQQAIESNDVQTAQSLSIGQTPSVGTPVNNAQGLPIGVRMPDGSYRRLSQAEIDQLNAANNQYLGK